MNSPDFIADLDILPKDKPEWADHVTLLSTHYSVIEHIYTATGDGFCFVDRILRDFPNAAVFEASKFILYS